MFFRKLTYLLLVSATFFSCSEYEKAVKSTDANLKYKKAIEYYEKEDYGRAMTLFEQLQMVSRGTKRNDTVMFYLANCYYEQNDFIMAGSQYKNFTRIYANSPFAEQSEFMIGYCNYMLSPRPELDQAETVMAIESFKLFMVKYPLSEKTNECKAMINELNEKLVEKSYISAKLYFDLGEFKASIIALNNGLTDYPDTKYREDMMFFILKSNYLLADGSIFSKQRERYQSTLDEYYSFISEFPQSRYKKEVDKMYEATVKALKIENTVNNN